MNVLVVGAGIVGVCAALALQRRGLRTTLIDATGIAQGCSFGNAGVITPSAFPLTRMAPFRALPRLLLATGSPVTIEWKHALQLAGWFRHYAVATRHARAIADTKTLHDLARGALAGYEALLDRAMPSIERRGYLLVYLTPHERDAAVAVNRVRAALGVRVRDLTAAELNDLEPSLQGVGLGATLIEDAAHVGDPATFTQAVFTRFVERGGSYAQDEILRIERAHDGRAAVIGRKATLEADKVVLCTGARANELLRGVGAAIPLIAERGYHVTLGDQGPQVSRPVGLPALGGVLSPVMGRTRLVGLSHFGPPGSPARPQRLADMARRLRAVLPTVSADPAAHVWSGERPASPDSLPIVDRVGGFESLFVCTGHGHTGLTLGAVTAELVAGLVCGDYPELARRLSLARFDGRHRVAALNADP